MGSAVGGRLPGDRRLRGDGRGRGCRRSAVGSAVHARRGDARCRRRRGLGAGALPRARTCATRCSMPGALVETLETVTFWSSAPALYGAVTAALRESLTGAGDSAGRSSATSLTCIRRGPRCTSRSPARSCRIRSPVARGQGGGQRRDPGRRGLDQPPPRGRPRPPRVVRRGIGAAWRRGRCARSSRHSTRPGSSTRGYLIAGEQVGGCALNPE